NCTAPRHIASLTTALRGATGTPTVAYPNPGEPHAADTKRWLPPEHPFDLAHAASGWVELGARAVGGCCRTGPGDISRLRRQLLGSR
ncbi:MAG: homocysteine S-methyltransferase, partial [bacterium]|nr:homocysteine S-methyltransferase [bacterium]